MLELYSEGIKAFHSDTFVDSDPANNMGVSVLLCSQRRIGSRLLNSINNFGVLLILIYYKQNETAARQLKRIMFSCLVFTDKRIYFLSKAGCEYMKKVIALCGLLLCLALASCYNYRQSDPASAMKTSPAPPSDGVDSNAPSDVISPSAKTTLTGNEKEAYIKAYTDFLLHSDIAVNNGFIDGYYIYGIYLFDLNYDNIPELGVLYDSGGSMGGYFTYYCFDGNTIVPVLDEKNEPARSSNYTQILADSKNKRIYLLKEMYLLRGNENGTYGYIREIADQNGIPYVYDILDLEVDLGNNSDIDMEMSYDNENEYLSAVELDEYLITRHYSGGEWIEISSGDYLKLKTELIPEENDLVDLCDTDVYIIINESYAEMWDEDSEQFVSKWITKEEIDTLFAKWLQYIE